MLNLPKVPQKTKSLNVLHENSDNAVSRYRLKASIFLKSVAGNLPVHARNIGIINTNTRVTKPRLLTV